MVKKISFLQKIRKGNDFPLSLDYQGLIPLLVSSVKQLEQQNQTLRRHKQNLEERLCK